MTQTKKPSQKPPTQARRRTIFGLNVLIAVAAAVGIVLLLNWIVAWQDSTAPASVKDWLRYDLTATRKYSLSDQTKNLLSELEGDYQIVSIFDVDGSNEYLDDVQEVVQEYGRYGANVQTSHINPSRDISKTDAFYAELRKRYEADLAPLDKAIADARSALNAASDQLTAMLAAAKQASEHPDLGDGPTKQFLEQLVAALSRLDPDVASANEKLDREEGRALPDYAALQNDVLALMKTLSRNTLSVAVAELERLSKQNDTPPAVRDSMLRLAAQMGQVKTQLDVPFAALRRASVSETYSDVRLSVTSEPTVTVIGPQRVAVIPVTRMYRASDDPASNPDDLGQLRFLGEEQLTGALVAMNLDPAPMVVFVVNDAQPAIGRNGQYLQVAERLRATGFDVRSWNPAGQFGPMGERTPPGPPPVPAEGQTAVWIALPIVQDPRNPMGMMQGGPKEQIAALLARRLDAGDGVMLILPPELGSGFGNAPEDPLLEMLKPWGIKPDPKAMVLREQQLPNRRTAPVALQTVSRWSGDMPVTKALAGLLGVFRFNSPIDTTETDGVTHYPLVTVRGERLWAERNHLGGSGLSGVKWTEEAAADAFNIAVAAERDGARLVTVANPTWATDGFTISRYPANSELFVNSVYWLAGEDELIAAGARTQDIRRVKDMSPRTLGVIQLILIAGLPALCLLAGLGVWLVRRAG